MKPSRGDVWLVELDPTRGHEQSGTRPGLVISVDPFNYGPAGLVVILPVTSKAKGIPSHVALLPPEGGVKDPSWVKCEDVRSVSTERLVRRWGSVSSATMRAIESRLRMIVGL